MIGRPLLQRTRRRPRPRHRPRLAARQPRGPEDPPKLTHTPRVRVQSRTPARHLAVPSTTRLFFPFAPVAWHGRLVYSTSPSLLAAVLHASMRTLHTATLARFVRPTTRPTFHVQTEIEIVIELISFGTGLFDVRCKRCLAKSVGLHAHASGTLTHACTNRRSAWCAAVAVARWDPLISNKVLN